jgi:uncharacterized protein
VRILRLTIAFHLPACRSLKDKRRRLQGLRDRFGSKPNVAASESNWHDLHDRAQWTFVVVGESQAVLEATQESILSYASQYLDAVVVDSAREYLV